MITSTEKKVKRHVRLVHSFEEGNGSALIAITVKTARTEKTAEYWLDRLPGAERTYVVTKREVPADPQEDFTYTVTLANAQDHQCNCKGHSRWGHCRHVEAILALLRAGKI